MYCYAKSIQNLDIFHCPVKTCLLFIRRTSKTYTHLQVSNNRKWCDLVCRPVHVCVLVNMCDIKGKWYFILQLRVLTARNTTAYRRRQNGLIMLSRQYLLWFLFKSSHIHPSQIKEALFKEGKREKDIRCHWLSPNDLLKFYNYFSVGRQNHNQFTFTGMWHWSQISCKKYSRVCALWMHLCLLTFMGKRLLTFTTFHVKNNILDTMGLCQIMELNRIWQVPLLRKNL